MCIDWFSIDISDESDRPIPGLRVRWAIFSPKANSYGNLGPSFQASLLLKVSEPIAPSWILNSPSDWLKITSANLDLENNRVYCSRKNSLLSFWAPDWLLLIWARYSSSTDENFNEFAQSSEHVLKVIMTKFAEFVNGHSSVWMTTKKYMPGLYSGYQSHASSNDFFLSQKLRFGGRQSNVSMTVTASGVSGTTLSMSILRVSELLFHLYLTRRYTETEK